jgi:hypothetical protein
MLSAVMRRATGWDGRFCPNVLWQNARELIDKRMSAQEAYLNMEKTDPDRLSFKRIIVRNPGGFALAK